MVWQGKSISGKVVLIDGARCGIPQVSSPCFVRFTTSVIAKGCTDMVFYFQLIESYWKVQIVHLGEYGHVT